MPDITYIEAGRLVTPSAVVEDGAVLVESRRIVAVGARSSVPRPQGAAGLAAEVVMPGFIDLHVHGSNGNAFGEGTDIALAAAADMAPAGVTTCYAGMGAGATLEALAESVESVAPAVRRDADGPRIEGIFLEGPFISKERKGAWVAEQLRLPSVDELALLIERSGGTIRRVNVAPELPGAIEFIAYARSQGIVVSIGHSNATAAEAIAAVNAGASIANHTFNAMSALDHRSPGLVGVALTNERLLAELILDHVHVHPMAAAVLWRARGAKGIALITDGTAMRGLPDGAYGNGARTVIIKDGSCRLPDGTLAGSVVTFDQCVRNAAQLPGIDLLGLAQISSGNAAVAMGIEGRTGSIRAGLDADIVLMSADLRVLGTMVRGRLVYRWDRDRGASSSIQPVPGRIAGATDVV